MINVRDLPDGNQAPVDLVHDVGNTDFMMHGRIYENAPVKPVMISSEDDLNTLTNYGPGTIAYLAGFTGIWQKGLDGSWEAIVEPEA